MNPLIQFKKITPVLLVWFALVCFSLSPSAATGTRPALSRPEAATNVSQRTLTFAERVAYQRAIEDVYWRHRIWPRSGGENPDPKPSLDGVMPQAQLEKKVGEYLRNSQELEGYWQQPITADQLQAEMDRMARDTKQPEVLRELFEALGNDPDVIAECLARPILAERLIADLSMHGQPRHVESPQTNTLRAMSVATTVGQVVYILPKIADTSDPPCTDDTWMAANTVNAPEGRYYHTAVWTGSEMIVWGGSGPVNTGGRYNPVTDNWIPITTTNAPVPRGAHTAVWTGNEMIVWGGIGHGSYNSGGRYNPSTDSWTATSRTNAPSAREGPTAVWTGREMIVWGGYYTASTGGRYNPSTDSWTPTSTTNAPSDRYGNTAVWTGSEMIVWGGGFRSLGRLNSGGRYNPFTNSWTRTSRINAPSARAGHTAVWTGSEMIVWGGDLPVTNSGGRYNPFTDSWTPTSTTNAPTPRYEHTAVWTGNEMIVWGGFHSLNTGGRYCAYVSPQLGNISTRAFVQTGDDVMIGGFIVQGAQTKRVIIRAIGPELTQYGVPDALANPTLELHNGTGALIGSNNNWATTIIGGIITANQVREIQVSGYAPGDALESAIIADLPPGNYTAIVRGENNMTGVALVEVYDLSPETNSILGNISTRAFVQTDDNVMIGGFIVRGTQPKRVIIRAIGPELSAPPFNVPNALANPTLELHDGTGRLIASNNNWATTIIGGIITANQVREIQASGYVPGNGFESAIIADLRPGNYTAIVRGVNNTSGVGLVEVYDLD